MPVAGPVTSVTEGDRQEAVDRVASDRASYITGAVDGGATVTRAATPGVPDPPPHVPDG